MGPLAAKAIEAKTRTANIILCFIVLVLLTHLPCISMERQDQSETDFALWEIKARRHLPAKVAGRGVRIGGGPTLWRLQRSRQTDVRHNSVIELPIVMERNENISFC